MVFHRRVEFCIVVLIGCASCSPPDGMKRVRVAPPRATPTGALWLFADSQIHNTTGALTRSKSALADQRASNVAIRPPSLDIWADVVLASISARIHREAGAAPAFFLGDAANVSCIEEYTRFLDAIGGELLWFGAPGNHDGFFMGNFTFEPRGATGVNSWQGACAS